MPTQQNHTHTLPEKPLVSFIVTTYNLPSCLLTECLQSILALSLRDQEREIILVDDGSDISPLNELCEYQNQFTYIRQVNQGLSVARNIGLHHATGTYIQFVDADDLLIPFAYEHCLDIIRYRQPEVVLFDVTDKTYKTTTFKTNGPTSGSSYLSNHNIRAAAWGYLFKKSILHGLQFTKGIVHEDEEFTPQLLLHAETLYTTDAKAYFYRKREGSITNDLSKRSILKRLNDTEEIIYRFQEKIDFLPDMERKAMKRRIAQLSMDYLYNVARYTHSIRYLNKAIDRLTKHGLYPLPNKDYTRNYQLFRTLIQTKTGRRLLIASTLK